MTKYIFKKIKGLAKTIILVGKKSKDKSLILNSLKFYNISKELEGKIKNKLSFFSFDYKNLNTISLELRDNLYFVVYINETTSENVRRAYSNLFKIINKSKLENIELNFLDDKKNLIIPAIEGFELSNYNFYKKYKKQEEKKTEKKIYLNLKKEIYEGKISETLKIINSVKLTRDLVNENSSIITPEKIEEISKKFSKKYKLKIKVLNEKQIKKEGLNLLYNVGKGSNHPPRLIIMEYLGNKNSEEIVGLVGKGITFDTGGINLKPTGYLEDMKLDMAGVATVFGAFKSIVESKVKKNILCTLVCAENSIGPKAYQPGDIIKSYSGQFVEIANTDAEGRLILADALSYLQRNHKVTKIIDLATLTGACLVALGPNLIAMFGNDEKEKEKMFNSGEYTFERVWELPIYEEYRELIKSKFADIKNNGGREGGTITAAAFLERFIEKGKKWIHLDIAGAAKSSKEFYYIPEFATGRGVRLLVNYLR